MNMVLIVLSLDTHSRTNIRWYMLQLEIVFRVLFLFQSSSLSCTINSNNSSNKLFFHFQKLKLERKKITKQTVGLYYYWYVLRAYLCKFQSFFLFKIFGFTPLPPLSANVSIQMLIIILCNYS